MDKLERNKKWLEDNGFELVHQNDETMLYVKETQVEMKKGYPKSCFLLKVELWKSHAYNKDMQGKAYTTLDCGGLNFSTGYEDDVRKSVKEVMNDIIYSSRNILAAATEMSTGF